MQRTCQENCHLQESISDPAAREDPHLRAVLRGLAGHAVPGEGEDCQEVRVQPPGGVCRPHHPLSGGRQRLRGRAASTSSSPWERVTHLPALESVARRKLLPVKLSGCSLLSCLLASGEEHWLLDTSQDEVYWPCSHSRAIPSFPSQLEWKIGLAWANTRGSLNSPS